MKTGLFLYRARKTFLVNYINELQSLGYRISADIQYKDRVETITVLDHGAAAEIEDVIKALDNLEK